MLREEFELKYINLFYRFQQGAHIYIISLFSDGR